MMYLGLVNTGYSVPNDAVEYKANSTRQIHTVYLHITLFLTLAQANHSKQNETVDVVNSRILWFWIRRF